MQRLLLVSGPGDQGRSGVRVANEACVDAGESTRRVLLVPDQLLQQGQTLTAVFRGPGDACPAAVPLRALPGQVIITDACIVAWPRFARLVLVEPRTDLIAELELVSREV